MKAIRPGVLLAAAVGSAVLGCAAAPKVVSVPVPPASFKPRQEIEIWRDSSAVTLHGVRIAADSLTGVPLWRPPDCDSCRVTMRLQTVDSLRTVSTERSWMVAASLPFVALGVVAATWWLADED